jgi:hypothetical protein
MTQLISGAILVHLDKRGGRGGERGGGGRWRERERKGEGKRERTRRRVEGGGKRCVCVCGRKGNEINGDRSSATDLDFQTGAFQSLPELLLLLHTVFENLIIPTVLGRLCVLARLIERESEKG